MFSGGGNIGGVVGYGKARDVASTELCFFSRYGC